MSSRWDELEWGLWYGERESKGEESTGVGVRMVAMA